MPVTFKEITPNYSLPEKWKEIMLNTGIYHFLPSITHVLRYWLQIINILLAGGTHSTLQDIKLPQKAGGYWYKDSKKVYTRNRFIYW